MENIQIESKAIDCPNCQGYGWVIDSSPAANAFDLPTCRFCGGAKQFEPFTADFGASKLSNPHYAWIVTHEFILGRGYVPQPPKLVGINEALRRSEYRNVFFYPAFTVTK